MCAYVLLLYRLDACIHTHQAAKHIKQRSIFNHFNLTVMSQSSAKVCSNSRSAAVTTQ